MLVIVDSWPYFGSIQPYWISGLWNQATKNFSIISKKHGIHLCLCRNWWLIFLKKQGPCKRNQRFKSTLHFCKKNSKRVSWDYHWSTSKLQVSRRALKMRLERFYVHSNWAKDSLNTLLSFQCWTKRRQYVWMGLNNSWTSWFSVRRRSFLSRYTFQPGISI